MISSDPILDALERFPAVRGHLDAATSGVPPTSSVSRGVREAVDAWAEGRIDGPAFDLDVQRSREAFARIVGVHADDIACGGSASVFAGLVAAAVPAGGEVVFATGDFTSVVFPMLAQEPRGIRVREVPLERIPEAIDARTSLVAVSAVQSADGRLIDLDALAARRRAPRRRRVPRRHPGRRLAADRRLAVHVRLCRGLQVVARRRVAPH